MKKRAEWIEALCRDGFSLVSSLCAALMLCVIPLVFRNAFFDINRIKVYTLYTGVPVMIVCMLLAVVLDRRKGEFALPGRSILLCFAAMALFLTSCLASYCVTGFRAAALLGNEGRSAGLLFYACCCAAFYLIASGAVSAKKLLPVIEISAGVIALLGVLNALGVDPLGFYARIKKGQEQLFMSTIGHFDFFGTYLVMLLPLAGASFVFSRNTIKRMIGAAAAVLISLGAAASRTDSALLGVHLGCIALVALSGGSLRLMSRALIIWGIGFLSLPIMAILFRLGSFGISFSGPHAVLCGKRIALIAALFLFAAAFLCRFLARKGVRAPGRKTMTAIVLIVFFCALLALLGAMAYFTVVKPQADLGEASGFLRFDDAWGSYRGFVYKRAIDAFGTYTPEEKIFGKGLDTTKSILRPYFDHPVVKIVGVFDDTHNQLLQLLLTGGILTAGSFALFYVVMLVTLYRHADRDPLLCGATASVFAYLIVMLINVTQPILIMTYFSLCALALGRMNYIDKRRRNDG